jgi:hypothetical protein
LVSEFLLKLTGSPIVSGLLKEIRKQQQNQFKKLKPSLFLERVKEDFSLVKAYALTGVVLRSQFTSASQGKT